MQTLAAGATIRTIAFSPTAIYGSTGAIVEGVIVVGERTLEVVVFAVVIISSTLISIVASVSISGRIRGLVSRT